MIRKIRIENFKSIPSLTLELGRVTVLVGANGSGKSNVLEAIAFASAASQQKLYNEFLISRGIRVTETSFMHSAFSKTPPSSAGKPVRPTSEKAQGSNNPIVLSVSGDGRIGLYCELVADESSSYPKWNFRRTMNKTQSTQLLKYLKSFEQKLDSSKQHSLEEFLAHMFEEWSGNLPDCNRSSCAEHWSC